MPADPPPDPGIAIPADQRIRRLPPPDPGIAIPADQRIRRLPPSWSLVSKRDDWYYQVSDFGPQPAFYRLGRDSAVLPAVSNADDLWKIAVLHGQAAAGASWVLPDNYALHDSYKNVSRLWNQDQWNAYSFPVFRDGRVFMPGRPPPPKDLFSLADKRPSYRSCSRGSSCSGCDVSHSSNRSAASDSPGRSRSRSPTPPPPPSRSKGSDPRAREKHSRLSADSTNRDNPLYDRLLAYVAGSALRTREKIEERRAAKRAAREMEAPSRSPSPSAKRPRALSPARGRRVGPPVAPPHRSTTQLPRASTRDHAPSRDLQVDRNRTSKNERGRPRGRSPSPRPLASSRRAHTTHRHRQSEAPLVPIPEGEEGSRPRGPPTSPKGLPSERCLECHVSVIVI